jgi:AcrR family transcriptional regulator
MPSVTRRTQGSRKERRATIERQLLQATERLMGEGLAFTEISVDRLATEAGISRATFYVYFEDKGQLLRQLAQQVFDELADAARVWWQVARGQNVVDLRAAMTGIIATYRKHQPLLTAIIEMAAYDADVAATYRVLLDGIIDAVRETIEQGQASGAIRPLPSVEMASALTWMVERACHQMLPDAPPGTDARLADALTEATWGALYLRSAGC